MLSKPTPAPSPSRAPIIQAVPPSRVCDVLEQLCDSSKDRGLFGRTAQQVIDVDDENQFDELVQAMDVWFEQNSINPGGVRIDWSKGKAMLYLPTPMHNIISTVVGPRVYEVSQLFESKDGGGGLFFGGSLRVDIFDWNGSRSPDHSIYNLQGLCPETPAVVFDVYACTKLEATEGLQWLTNRALDWLGATCGVMAAITILVVIDEGAMALSDLSIQKWSPVGITERSETNPYTFIENTAKGLVEYCQDDGTWIEIEKRNVTEVVVDGNLNDDALKSNVSLTPLDLGFDEDQAALANLPWDEPALNISVDGIYKDINRRLELIKLIAARRDGPRDLQKKMDEERPWIKLRGDSDDKHLHG